MQKIKTMKKLLLITIILLPAFIKAQQYVPFPDSNAVWSEIEIDQPGPCMPCKYQFRILGDTIINSIQYHKIYKQNDSLLNSVNLIYHGAIREQGGKIYFRHVYFSFERTLYDFTKNVGDTIKKLYHDLDPSDSSMFGIITSIDSILIDGNYRKKFALNANDPIWIEGIGSLHGLLYPITPAVTCSCIWDLVCFQQNDSVKYLNPKYSTCFPVITGISNNTTVKNSFAVLPNPFSTETTLRADKLFRDATLTVYNSFGQQVKLIKNISGQTVTLHRDNLPSGLYFLQLTQDNKTYATDKLIIIDN